MSKPETEWGSDYLDLIDALSAEHAEYLIVGAFALAQHGHLRATADIDIFVRPSAENSRKVINALRAFGAPLDSAGVTEADFATPGQTYQLGVKPQRVGILTDLSGIDFEHAQSGQVIRMVLGRSIPFIGVEALKKTKRASRRPKALADVAWLEKAYPSK